MTSHWLLAQSPLIWVQGPEEIEDWQLLGPQYWERYVRANATQDGQSLIPPMKPEHYPRLIRKTRDIIVFDKQAAPGTYEHLIRVMPPLFEGEEVLKLKLKKIKKAAEELGMLFHPQYGDSAFAWANASLTFQALQWLWQAIEKQDEYGGKYYRRALDKLFLRYNHVKVQVDKQVSFTPSSVPNPVGLLWEGLPDKEALREAMYAWLIEELSRSLNTYGMSESHFHIEDLRPHKAVLPKRSRFFVEAQGLNPFFVIRSGLYAFALYDFFLAFKAGGELRSCAGCERLFFPTRANQKHCPSSSTKCRQRAHRKHKTEKQLP